MPPRPTRPDQNKACATCPSARQKKTQSSTSTAQPHLAITMPGEGERLWKHVLFGTSTCISMIEGYAALDMPGDCQNTIASLRDRLNAVLNNLVERSPHVSSVPTEK